jgi:hypothetical protein
MTEKVCSKGWGARCAVAKGKRCRCKCGGENHGGAVRPFDITETPFKSRSDVARDYRDGWLAEVKT